MSLIATQLVHKIWGISVALVGGSFSPSKFLDLNSSQRKAVMVIAPLELYIDQTNLSMGNTSSGSSDGLLSYQQTKHPSYMLLRRQIPFGLGHRHQPRQSSRHHVNKHQSRHQHTMIHKMADDLIQPHDHVIIIDSIAVVQCLKQFQAERSSISRMPLSRELQRW